MGRFRRRMLVGAVTIAAAASISGCALVGPALIYEAARPRPAVNPIPQPSGSPRYSDGLASYYLQKVFWVECGSAECTTVQVPLDYDNPDGEVVELAVTRVRATGTSIGSLFVNPGGPGGSAVDYAKAADYVVSSQVRDHYDVIGFDPRGVGLSDPIQCLTDEQRDELAAMDGTPDTPAEEQEIIDTSALVTAGCADKASPMVRFIGTVNAARDMDIVRSVVGDPVLNYLGKSYGTYLGAVYAELFPERVGRMVLDGVLPPGLDLVQVAHDQAASFEDAFAHFADDCAEQFDCPFEGTGPEVAKQLRSYLKDLDAHPIPGDGRKLDEALATYAVLMYLYFPSYDYPALRRALNSAVKDGDGKPMLDLLDERMSRAPDGHYLDNSTDAFYAVTCADRTIDLTFDQVRKYAEQWARELPTFGESIAWGLLACADWTAPADPAVMVARADGSPPILLVSTTHDPATPHGWGKILAKQMANARLLTWDGHGHTAYLEGSGCIDEAVDAYLLAGTLPAEGTVCDRAG